MEIIEQKIDLIDKVPAQYQPYIQAMRTPDLRSQAPIDNYKAIYKYVLLAIEYTGSLKAEEDNANKFITENLLKELLIKFPFIRHGEIELAFKKGALKEYGDYFGINVQTLYGWIKKYMESGDLIAAKRQWIDLIETPKAAKPVTNLDLTESIRTAFNDYVKTGELPFTASHYYIILCKLLDKKTLITSNETRVLIREEAMKEYRSSLVEKKINIKDKPQFDVLLKWCMEGKNPSYDSHSRRLALKHFFDECLKLNKQPI